MHSCAAGCSQIYRSSHRLVTLASSWTPPQRNTSCKRLFHWHATSPWTIKRSISTLRRRICCTNSLLSQCISIQLILGSLSSSKCQEQIKFTSSSVESISTQSLMVRLMLLALFHSRLNLSRLIKQASIWCSSPLQMTTCIGNWLRPQPWHLNQLTSHYPTPSWTRLLDGSRTPLIKLSRNSCLRWPNSSMTRSTKSTKWSLIRPSTLGTLDSSANITL